MALRIMKSITALICALILVTLGAQASTITIAGVDPGTNADGTHKYDGTQLAAALLDANSVSLVAGSAKLYGGYADAQTFQSAIFNYANATSGATTDLGSDFTNGIILSTGNAYNIQFPDVIGVDDYEVYKQFLPNSGDASFVWYTDNNTALPFTTAPRDLANLLNVGTVLDPNVLEFKFVLGPGAWNLNLKYVFGSDEYVNYYGSAFNDALAIFINDGVNDVNVGVLSDGTIVSVNNKIFDPLSVANSDGTPNLSNGLYRNNIPYLTNGSSTATTVQSLAKDLSLDGLTDVLAIQPIVLNGGTESNPVLYTARIVIGDVGNADVDSAVFIQGGSFSANPVIPEPATLLLMGTGLVAIGLLRRRVR
jgi:hypothetical protein